MPRRVKTKRRPSGKVVRRRRQRGGSFWGSLKRFGSKANKWLRKTHTLSKAAKLASLAGVPGASTAGSALGILGYGKKKRMVRRRRGAGTSLPGGAIRLAGKRRVGCGKKNMPRGIMY